jgi:hypothetical protein
MEQETTQSNIADEYLGDIKLEDVFRLLTNYNPHINSMPAILLQFRGLRCIVTAEFEHDRISPEEMLKKVNEGLREQGAAYLKQMPESKHFLRLVIEPDFDEALDDLKGATINDN